MAVNGVFTYEDLYASRSRKHNYKFIRPLSSYNIPEKLLSEPDF